jgi:hypothetical protein
MSALIIPLALLAGFLLGYPDAVVAVGTIWACVARFAWETVRDCLEALR